MRVEPFEADHFRRLLLQPHQEVYQERLREHDWHALAAAGEAWTALDGDEVRACAGFVDLGEGRGEAWALVAGDAARQMTAMTRALRRGLTITRYRFIQAHAAADFPPAARWLRLLGFAYRGRLPCWCADGGDAEIWTWENAGIASPRTPWP